MIWLSFRHTKRYQWCHLGWQIDPLITNSTPKTIQHQYFNQCVQIKRMIFLIWILSASKYDGSTASQNSFRVGDRNFDFLIVCSLLILSVQVRTLIYPIHQTVVDAWKNLGRNILHVSSLSMDCGSEDIGCFFFIRGNIHDEKCYVSLKHKNKAIQSTWQNLIIVGFVVCRSIRYHLIDQPLDLFSNLIINVIVSSRILELKWRCDCKPCAFNKAMSRSAFSDILSD